MALATECYDTALCIIPRLRGARLSHKLRSYHNKGYGEWPQHINLIYPFVQPGDLSSAAEAINSAVQNRRPFRIRLDTAQKEENVYRRIDHTSSQYLSDLRRAAVEALGQEDPGDYQIDLNVAQSEEEKDQAGPLTGLDWDVRDLYILQVIRREPNRDSAEKAPARDSMQAWARIPIGDGGCARLVRPVALPDDHQDQPSQDKPCPCFYHRDEQWEKATPGLRLPRGDTEASALAISTYSVSADPQRYPWLVRNILADDAKAEILVLQQVTDGFLSYLLIQNGIRKAFPFCSHGPPDQEDVEPALYHCNVVVLSKYVFDWHRIPVRTLSLTGRLKRNADQKFLQCNDGRNASLLVEFRELGTYDLVRCGVLFRPLTLAAVDLSHGRTDNPIWESVVPSEVTLPADSSCSAESVAVYDASMAVMRRQIDEIVDRAGPNRYPTILAGNFNAPTSSHTISRALALEGRNHLRGLLKALDGFRDVWTICRLERTLGPGDDVEAVFEGEHGATYDPAVNTTATQAMGRDLCMRPQRFDKVLVRGKREDFQILGCNRFGYTRVDDDGEKGERSYASDHWGLRAVLRLGPDQEGRPSAGPPTASEHLIRAPGPLADAAELMAAMGAAHAIPSEEEVKDRAAAFQFLKTIILGMGSLGTRFEVEPVGTYGSGMWTSSSQIECICIGTSSHGTFFQLASEHLLEAVGKGVSFKRVGQEHAQFIELSVHHIRFQLRYAAVSHALLENWPHAVKYPGAGTVEGSWATVQKPSSSALNPVLSRDYVRRSVPDTAQFQLAYRFLQTWAERRGLYGDRAYLTHEHITAMLMAIYKAWAYETAVLSVPDILASFFSRYAKFDVEKDATFDSTLNKDAQMRRPQMDRHQNNPVGPNFPTLGQILHDDRRLATRYARTIVPELKGASETLSRGISWTQFLESDGVGDFLHSFKLYCKIDVQFWGGSLTKGRGLVHWVSSRLLGLASSMQMRLGDYHVRLWPARWVDMTEQTVEPDNQAGHYQCCYLIGLESEVDVDETMHNKAMYYLKQFEAATLNVPNRFTSPNSWHGVSVVRSVDLASLAVDNRDWHEYSLTGDDEDEKKEAGGQQRRHPTPPEDEDETPAAWAKANKKNKTGRKHGQHPWASTAPKPEGAGALRPAQDVLNRLRWDPGMDSADYAVGYLDRFAGAMERDLDEWKAEQTDEEFIPQHRILWFRRKGDGVVVWDRKTRTDLVFGG